MLLMDAPPQADDLTGSVLACHLSQFSPNVAQQENFVRVSITPSGSVGPRFLYSTRIYQQVLCLPNRQKQMPGQQDSLVETQPRFDGKKDIRIEASNNQLFQHPRTVPVPLGFHADSPQQRQP